MQMRILLVTLLITLLSTNTLTQAATKKSDLAGARVIKPFKLIIPNAECVSSTHSPVNVSIGFPNRSESAALRFTLGPSSNSHFSRQEHNKPYSGAGTYSHVGIVAKSKDGHTYQGLGTVVVNADERTGTFKFIPDYTNSANPDKTKVIMGIWDCGAKISRR